MKFLQNIPPYLFFTGKGGVGKTSISCATAIHLAEQGKRVLLVSTDPASNVGQVFNQTIGNAITPVTAVPDLSALEIDPQQAAEQYRARIVDPIKGLLPEEVVNSIREQLSGACTTEIAAFDEFTGLLTDASLLARFDHIIFDTAPTGHTIRLLQLPGAWSSFIESNPDGASCLGPMAGLEKQREQYADAVEALSDPERTRLVLVARLQKSTLQEVARTHEELAAIGLKNQYLVINGVLPESGQQNDPLAMAIVQREQEALVNLPAGLSTIPADTLFLQPVNMVGVPALKGLFNTRFEPAPLSGQVRQQFSENMSFSELVNDIARSEHGLIMLMGKGGVGKTTMAAAIAVRLADMGFDVHLTTSDPAAHINTTLNGTLNNLQVSRINPQEETERYRQHVLETKGKDLDEAGKRLLEEDLRSPCTEEIAVFQAFSRVIREAGKRFVVMDTAPTGHTLLLLDATGAYHREIAKKMGEKGHFTTPMMQLQDPQRTKVLLVTLPETTPVLEAANLQADLKRAGIHPWGWIINNCLSIAETRSSLLCQRATQERPQIEAVMARHAKRVALVPLFAQEPTGIEKLRKLASYFFIQGDHVALSGGCMLLAGAIFVLTIVLVIWQPKGLGIGWSATLGAVLALLTGVVHPGDIPVVWNIVWNATAAFIAVIIISLLLDESGFFEWAALHVSRWGNGRGRLLFTWIVLLGAAVAALFANDGAALILTPIVIAMLLALGFSKGTTLAFVMAAGFIADTASLPLIVSNLVNIVSADFFGLGFREYASVMVPVDIAAIVATLVMLHLYFRKDIPQNYDMALLKSPAEAIKDPATFKTGWFVLLFLLVGFFVLEPLGIPVSAIAAVGALILFAVAKRGHAINTGKVLRGAPWQIVIFSLGMYLVVYGLRNAGLTEYLSGVLNVLAENGLWAATLGTGFLTAFLSSIMNNMPTVLVGALSIDGSTASGVIKEAMVYANVIGCDLGPKITPIGSLATLLWLHVLSQKNMTISWGYYFRTGIIMTLPVLFVTLAALALRLSFTL